MRLFPFQFYLGSGDTATTITATVTGKRTVRVVVTLPVESWATATYDNTKIRLNVTRKGLPSIISGTAVTVSEVANVLTFDITTDADVIVGETVTIDLDDDAILDSIFNSNDLTDDAAVTNNSDQSALAVSGHTMVIAHDGYRIDGGTLVPGTYLSDGGMIQQAPTTSSQSSTSLDLSEDSGDARRAILIIALPSALYDRTFTAAFITCHRVQFNLGATVTTMRHFTVAGVTHAATYNTKNGSTVWPGGAGGLSDANHSVTCTVDSVDGSAAILHCPFTTSDVQSAGDAHDAQLAVVLTHPIPASSLAQIETVEWPNPSERWTATFIYTSPPQIPVNISPSDGATGQDSCGVTLRWNPSNGADSYKIYFGTTATPPLLQSGVLSTFYVTGILAASTQYYWRIGAVNADGETLGPIWSFTTQTALGAATIPAPTNNATNVAVSPTFSFTAGAHATSHVMFLYKDGDPVPTVPTVNPATPSGFTLQTPLAHGTLYHWFIRSTEGCTVVNSATWNFTTLSLPGTYSDVPSAPDPTDSCDGSVRVAITKLALSWSLLGVNAPDTTKVYFATHLPLVTGDLIYNSTGVTTVPMPTLRYDTVYYWQVVNTNGAGTTPGPIWCFITAKNPNPPPTGLASGGYRNRRRPLTRADAFGYDRGSSTPNDSGIN